MGSADNSSETFSIAGRSDFQVLPSFSGVWSLLLAHGKLEWLLTTARSVHHVIGSHRSLYLLLRSGFSFLTSCPTGTPLSPRTTPFWRFFRTSIPSITSCRPCTRYFASPQWASLSGTAGARSQAMLQSSDYACEFPPSFIGVTSTTFSTELGWRRSFTEIVSHPSQQPDRVLSHGSSLASRLSLRILGRQCSEPALGLFAVFSVPGRWTSSKRSRISLVREHMGLMSVRWTQQKSGDSCTEGNPDTGEMRHVSSSWCGGACSVRPRALKIPCPRHVPPIVPLPFSATCISFLVSLRMRVRRWTP